MTRIEKIENFIGCYDGYLDKTLCDKAIQFFEQKQTLKETLDRFGSEKAPANLKSDEQFFCHYDNLDVWKDQLEYIMVNFNEALRHYLDQTSILQYFGLKEVHFTSMKIQKTKPGQGYHMWHVEKTFNHFELSKRVLVFTIYLNDVEGGGETEFLIQSQRIEPKAGRICIFPANFPYVHRGNPPLKGEKYILTSWLLA
jgi:hypothetical protein